MTSSTARTYHFLKMSERDYINRNLVQLNIILIPISDFPERAEPELVISE